MWLLSWSKIYYTKKENLALGKTLESRTSADSDWSSSATNCEGTLAIFSFSLLVCCLLHSIAGEGADFVWLDVCIGRTSYRPSLDMFAELNAMHWFDLDFVVLPCRSHYVLFSFLLFLVFALPLTSITSPFDTWSTADVPSIFFLSELSKNCYPEHPAFFIYWKSCSGWKGFLVACGYSPVVAVFFLVFTVISQQVVQVNTDCAVHLWCLAQQKKPFTQ